MALLNVIRRSASRFVPAVFNRAHLNSHHHHAYAPFAAVGSLVLDFQRNSLQASFLHSYCTMPSSDANLLRVIGSEITCAVESQPEYQTKELPPDFPFKIEDNPGEKTITLSREFKNETITVCVYMPDLVTGEENADEDSGDENDDDVEGRVNESCTSLVVRVSKKTGPFLEFDCTAYPDEITIGNFSVKENENSEDQIQYEGPDFLDLDENLQKSFLKYLEIRGIKPSTTNFLHAYMLSKDNREYITWLKSLEKFIQA